MNVLDAMKEHRLFCDGGMGSLLQAAGLAAGELPERWNLSHPEVITNVHRKYLAAGSLLGSFAGNTGLSGAASA